MNELKFEGKFKAGDKIRAYDFQPRDTDPESECYYEGIVVSTYDSLHGPSYLVAPTKHIFCGREFRFWVRDHVCVPFEVSNDWDTRVQLIKGD